MSVQSGKGHRIYSMSDFLVGHRASILYCFLSTELHINIGKLTETEKEKMRNGIKI